jgi:hypothetical protein
MARWATICQDFKMTSSERQLDACISWDFSDLPEIGVLREEGMFHSLGQTAMADQLLGQGPFTGKSEGN